MKKLGALYLKDFLRLFLTLCLGFSFVLSLISLLERLDDFLRHEPPLYMLLQFVIYNMPRHLKILFPICALIAALYVFSSARRYNEFTAVSASGGRLTRLMLPVILAGGLLSAVNFIAAETLSPYATNRAAEVRRLMEKKERKLLFEEGTVWMRLKDGIIARYEFFEPQSASASGVSLFEFGPEGGFLRRVEADSALYGQNGLAILNAVEYKLSGRGSAVLNSPVMEFPGLRAPDIRKEGIGTPDEMSLWELKAYLLKLRAAGFSSRKLEVDIQSKYAWGPLAFFFTVIGLGVSSLRRMGGMVSGALGVLISVFFLFMYVTSLSMGYSGVLGPLTASWITPCFAGLCAWVLYRKIPQ